MALSLGHPRGTHSRCVVGCCLIPLGICGLKNNSRRITYGIGCVWGMPSLSPLSSLDMTNSLRKKSYSENTKFNCWLVVIVFPFDDPLSVQETTIANRGNIFGNNFSLYLSICRLTTILYIAFSFEKLTETFVHKKD